MAVVERTDPRLARAMRIGIQAGRLVIGSEQDIISAAAADNGMDEAEVAELLRGADKSAGATAGQGFYWNGKAYLIAENIPDEALPGVLMHEATHGRQRERIDRNALEMIESRDSPANPPAVRALLAEVARRMEDAGETGNAREATPYLIEVAAQMARVPGSSKVDGKALSAIDAVSKRAGKIIRDLVAAVRAWALKRGFEITPTIDDLVALGRANVRDFVRDGALQQRPGPQASRRALQEQPETTGDRRAYKLDLQHEERRTSKNATLSPDEQARVARDAAAHGISPAEVRSLLAQAREVKRQYPTRDGWAPIELAGLDVKTAADTEEDADPSAGAPTVSLKWQPISYAFNKPPGARRAPARIDTEWAERVATSFYRLIVDIYDRAAAGDRNAQIIIGHQTWYRNVAEVLRREFGGQGDLLADLLGATSPNTPVDTNWKFSIDVLRRFVRGDFNEDLQKFDEYIRAGGAASKYPSADKIRQVSGKLYGMNSGNAMKALLDMWRILEPGSAPKARNFALNLIGQSKMATIDVWAARMLRRAADLVRGANLPRIPPPAEQGVTGTWSADVTRVTGEFGFGAHVMDRVSEMLARDGRNVEPLDLQAIAWFAEKELWGRNRWTTVTGEGGSFEENLEAMPVERFLAGWSIQKGERTPEHGAVSLAQARVMSMLIGDDSVVAARAAPTVGMSAGVTEMAFDAEWTVDKGKHDPSLVMAEIARLAGENEQYDIFVSRVIGPGEDNPNARPGVEIYFRTKRGLAEALPVLQKFTARGQDGFTMVVDPRATGGDEFIGLRLQYVPEISARWDANVRRELLAPGGLERVLQEKFEALRDIAAEVRTMNGVAFASTQLYDTVVVGKENYDGYVDRATREGHSQARGEVWFGQPVRQGLERAVARYEGQRRQVNAGGVPDAGGGLLAAGEGRVAFSRRAVRKAGREADAAEPAGPGVRGNVQPAAGVPGDTEAPAGDYFVRTIVGTEARRKLGADRILTAADAAAATRYLYRSAVERFDGIVTDANGKPLAVVGGFKGALAQAVVYPATIMGEAIRVPGAARIWFSHNHPSGKAALSRADENLGQALANVFRGSGIEPMGILAVAGDEFAFAPANVLDDPVRGDIPAARASVEVPVVERELSPRTGPKMESVSSPAAAKQMARDFYAQAKAPGLILLDAQQYPTAWVPLPKEASGRLRGTGGLRALYRAISEANAGNAILVHGGEMDTAPSFRGGVSAVENIGAALGLLDVRLLDAIDATSGVSFAERGMSLSAGPVYSRSELKRDGGLPMARVTEIAEGMRSGWANAPEVVVVRDMRDPAIPQAVRDADAKQRSQGAQGDPEGFWYGGRAYLVASALASDADVVRVLAHEALGHYGLRGVFGKRLASILDQVALARIDEVRAKAAEYGLPITMGDARAVVRERQPGIAGAELEAAARTLMLDSRRQAAEEVLAVMAQRQPQLGVVQRAIAAVRAWLRETFPRLNLRLSDAEIIRDYILPARTFVERGLPQEAAGDPAFSRSKQTAPKGAVSASGQWDAPDTSRVDDVIYALQDKQVDLKRVAERIKAAGANLGIRTDGYLREELYQGRVADRTRRFLDDELRPLLTSMRLAKVGLDQLEEYLMARHAPEANAYLQSINLERSDNAALSGMSNADAAKIMAAAPPVMESLAARVDDIIAGTRDLMEISGLETSEYVEGLRRAYEFYVPLHRDDDHPGSRAAVGQGFSVRGKSAKGRTGSTARVTNILAHIVEAREATITRAEKNVVALAVYAMAKQNPNPDFWTTETPPEVPWKDERRTVFNPRTGTMDENPNYGQVVMRADPQWASRPNVLAAKFNGAPVGVIFNERDPRALRMVTSLKNLDVHSLDGAMRVMATGTRWQAMVNTALNPVFMVVNFLRDVQGAAINLTSTEVSGEQLAAIGGIGAAARAIWRAERGLPAKDPKMAALYDEFRRRGAKTGYRESFVDIEARAKALQRELDSAGSNAARAITAVTDFMATANDTVENAVRLSVYRVALEKGMHPDRAASVAKNLTVNFNRKGAKTQSIGALYAFFNAAVQGNARLVETLKGPAGKRILAGGLAIGMLQALLLAGADDDDEEAIPDYVKRTSLVFPYRGGYVAIPMPLGLHVIPNVGRAVTEVAIALADGDMRKIPGQIVGLLGTVMDSMNPLGGAETPLQMIAPTLADPVVQLATNQGFSGRPIYRERSRDDASAPGYTLGRDSTNPAYTGAAYVIHMVFSGGNPNARNIDVPAALSPQPEALRLIPETIFGGLWRETEKIVDTTIALATGQPVEHHRIPLVSRFSGDTQSDAAVAGVFWNNVSRVGALEREAARAKKAGADGADIPEVGRRASAAKREVLRMMDARRRMEVDGAPRETIREVEREMTGVMREFNAEARSLRR